MRFHQKRVGLACAEVWCNGVTFWCGSFSEADLPNEKLNDPLSACSWWQRLQYQISGKQVPKRFQTRLEPSQYYGFSEKELREFLEKDKEKKPKRKKKPVKNEDYSRLLHL